MNRLTTPIDIVTFAGMCDSRDELLEALKACRTNIAGYHLRDGSEAPRLAAEFFNELQRIHNIARAAVAKAEGRS